MDLEKLNNDYLRLKVATEKFKTILEQYENDLKLGMVKEIQRYPLNDYLEIITDEELVNKGLPKVFLIPHIFDKYVIDINIETKTIRVIKSLEILENS